MKKNILILFLLADFHFLHSQTSADYAVPLTAATDLLGPSITVHWTHSDSATSYKVYRKDKNAVSWGAVLANLTTADTFYTDIHVSIDTGYEYKVERTAYNTVMAGYIYSAIRLPAVHDKGILLLAVDSLFEDSLNAEVYRLMKDIRGDGWEVKKIIVGRNESVVDVKANILDLVMQDSARTQALMLLGHIPVPYSGDLNPDGHPDHRGAWPADAYYADINGAWSDVFVNDSGASYSLNRNIPGDGKFDNTTIASSLELQISRIDFYDMPAIPRSELQLMKNYLDKDHRYRQKDFAPIHRGLVDDNFGAFGGEAFASCGYRNFAPLLGTDNIYNYDFISTLDTASYQWAYGCGGGSFTGAGGIGSTGNFANDSVKAIFTMLFGSYFGDWNSQNNFLRAPLCAAEPALTCCWAGRPYWFFHHMAMGENIGFSARITQNNPYLYSANYGVKLVHVALMGDLTLKEDAVAPPASITVAANTSSPFGATISWTASADTVAGYYIYKSSTEFGRYQLISGLISATTFNDLAGADGFYYYMVRASKLQTSPSGAYYNLSEGIIDSATVTYAPSSAAPKLESHNSLSIYPNPSSDKIFIVSEMIHKGDQMEIINVTGAIIRSKRISSDADLILDVTCLSNGIYFLLIRSEREIITKPFVVNR